MNNKEYAEKYPEKLLESNIIDLSKQPEKTAELLYKRLAMEKKNPNMLCPMCDHVLTWLPIPANYKQGEHHTHIYTCPECPFVGFEYYNKENTKDVQNYLEGLL